MLNQIKTISSICWTFCQEITWQSDFIVIRISPGSLANSFGEYISYNIWKCILWHFQIILKIADTKEFVEYKVKYEMKMKLRQNVIHSVSGSGYCETSKVERALTLDGGTSPPSIQPSKPPKEPHIHTRHFQTWKKIYQQNLLSNHRLNYSWSDCSWVFNLCFGTYLNIFQHLCWMGTGPSDFPKT